jgi:hypothetical protein
MGEGFPSAARRKEIEPSNDGATAAEPGHTLPADWCGGGCSVALCWTAHQSERSSVFLVRGYG